MAGAKFQVSSLFHPHQLPHCILRWKPEPRNSPRAATTQNAETKLRELFAQEHQPSIFTMC